MAIQLDEEALLRQLEPLLESPGCVRGIHNLASDPFFLAFFLVSVSQGEGLGEAAVGMIGQEELARCIRDLKRQEAEERGHKEQTLEGARELFPDYFDDGRYRYEASLQGRPYYVAVLQANRDRLKRLGRYSRLNLYLTTTFAYEIMVILLYGRALEAVRRATALPDEIRQRVAAILDRILSEEETHIGVVEQHNALLEMPRAGLSQEAESMLDSLEKLTLEDFAHPAELAVRQVVEMMSRYADPQGYRAEIEGAGAGASVQGG